MRLHHLTLTTLAMIGLILGGCAEVRTQTEKVSYLQKPLKPMPDVSTYVVSIDPPGVGSPSLLNIEGKKAVQTNGDVVVAMKVGEPEIANIKPGRDVYEEYARDKDGNTLYRDGHPIVTVSIPVYWIDVEVTTSSCFEMTKRDGAVLESQVIPKSTEFVYGKKPTKLLGGAVTLWSGSNWVTDPVWLAAQWQIQGPTLVRQRGAALQLAALQSAAGVIEQNYSEGQRIAEVPFAFYKDEQDDARLLRGYQAAASHQAAGFAEGVEIWQAVIDDHAMDADGKPATNAMQRACARLDMAAVHYIQADWQAASTLLGQAMSECGSYDEGFFEGLFKGNKSSMSNAIQRLQRMVMDRQARDAVNATPAAPAKPAA